MVRIFISFPQAGRHKSKVATMNYRRRDADAPVSSRFEDTSKDKCGNSSRRLSESSALVTNHLRSARIFRIFAAPVDVGEASRGALANVEEALPIGLDGEHADAE
jgi:hypothetical protein